MAPPCLSSLASRITRHSTLIALVLVAVATLFSVACSHAADAPAKTGAGRTVRAGIFNFKPLVIFDQESPPTGFIVDILNHIAKQEEWNVEYVPGTWQVSLERLRTDKIDIILCIGYSAERDEYLDFPKEHVLLDWGLVYRGKGSSINTILDMEGKTFAAMKASIYTEGFKNTLEQFNIKAKIVEKTEVKDVFGALESGEVDAAISSTIAGIPFESSRKVDRSPVVFTPVKLGYAVNSGKNADLTAAIDKRLAELKSDKNSYYYHKLDEWVTARSHTVPKMFYWIIGGISGALIVFIVFVIILRLQVKAKTNSLKVELKQRKRTEAELIASVEDLRDSQSIAHMGSWRLNLASNQVVWSEELYKMYGFDPKLPPPPYTEHQKLFTPESWERLSAALQNTKNTGFPYSLELKTLRPDGSSGWMWVRGMSVLDADGATVALRGMAQDITERKQAEGALLESEERFKALHNASFGGIAIHDRGVILDCNQGLSEISGFDHDELIGMDGLLLIAEQSRETVMNNIRSGYENPYEAFGLRKSGEQYPLRLEARNIPYQGKMVRVAEFRDITVRKRMEEVLRESEARFKTLFSNSPVSVIIHDKETGEIEDANEIAYKSYGFSSLEELRAKGFWTDPPYSADEALQWIHKAATEGVQKFEWMNRKTSGEVFWEQVTLRLITIEGVEKILSVTIDITERKRMEKALRASEEHYRALVNTIPHGITVLDREHRIVEINDSHARMFGHPREWFIGRHCYEVFEKRDHICPHCPGVHSMQTGEVAHTETEGVHDDGTRFPVMLHTAPFQFGDGTVGFIEVVEDITEKRKLEAIAIKTARLASLGEMASGVAHEINNPITGVINCAQLLKDRLPADSNCQDIVERISREGTRIAKIVKSLLMITHPGHHRLEKVWLRESLETVLTLSQAKLVGSGIQLHIDLPPDLPPIAGEPQMIEQLLLNLINNAHYALNERYPEHHEEKRLTVSATLKSASTGGRVCLAVHDQGAGVRAEHLGKLFDPFFTTKPAGVGTGLGLGLCYEIVKRHNGEIRVESELGHFTRVTVELPVLP